VRRKDLRQAIESCVHGMPQAALPLNRVPTARRTAGESAGRVLLAEDNVVNQKVAARMLERLGYEVDVAGDGGAALELHGRRRYDLVLLDCQMPVLDGYQSAKAMRERERHSSEDHVPIVALTANAMVEDRARCLGAGMDDYVSKPVRLEDLREILARWVSD
jgi:CheY-like chemotaxis protein